MVVTTKYCVQTVAVLSVKGGGLL